MKALLPAAAFLLCCAAAAMADEMVPLASLRTCAGLANSGERLACYDRLARGAAAGDDAAAQTPLTQEQMFGMRGQLTRKSEPIEATERRGLRSITAHVTSVHAAADGALVIELDNGQAWRQETAGDLLLAAGDEVKITRGALASFRLTTPGKRTARVVRVR